jgi:hypothetical protein
MINKRNNISQALIDQRLILNDSPSRMHNVEIPSQFEFLEHVESQFDHDNHVFDDYFSVLELNVSTNVSSNDPVQSEISDLNAQMLMTKNIRYVEHKRFFDPHEEIISNVQPITMQDTRNIELIQETLSPKSAPESHVNLQG